MYFVYPNMPRDELDEAYTQYKYTRNTHNVRIVYNIHELQILRDNAN